jgi:hypothetical protein
MVLTGLGETGGGMDVGLESGNCASSPHTKPKASCLTSHHAYFYIDNIHICVHI